MIPISDSPRRRNVPIVNVLIIFVNVAVFLYETTLSDLQLQNFVMSYGIVPAEIVKGLDLPPAVPFPIWLTTLTAMFIHGGWLHLGSNMLFLWVFGDNVEDRLGSLPYLFFYLVCGIIAALVQIATGPGSTVPSIGASGAIAGVLGAYILLFPRATVRSILPVIPFGCLFGFIPIPAVLMIGLWFIIQIFSGIADLGVATAQSGGVAYWAHIGGFVTGIVLVLAFRRVARLSRA